GYLIQTSGRAAEPRPGPASGGSSTGDQGAGIVPAIGSALGSLPQAAQGAAAAPVQGVGGLAGAAAPLAGLASGLADRGGEAENDLTEERTHPSKSDAAEDESDQKDADDEEDDPEDRHT